MSQLARALLDELGPDDLAALAHALRPYLDVSQPAGPGGWLNSRQAAQHLGISVHALRRLTAARELPMSQGAPGGRVFFRRADLDRWRDQAATP